MNSKILRPVSKIGSIVVKSNVGGETTEETILPIEAVDVSMYRLFPTKELRGYLSVLEREGLYDVINKRWVKKPNYKTLQEKRLTLRKLIEKRVNRWKEIRENNWRKSIEIKNVEYGITRFSIPTKISMISQNIDYEIVKKGETMSVSKNEVRYKEDKDGNLVKEKDCLIPYTREGGIKAKDFIILHRSGRLGAKTPSGKTVQLSSEFPLPEDEEGLQKLFKTMTENEMEFFVSLPKGGRRKKEYGEVPMPSTPYHKRGNEFIPLNEVVRKIYKPEIDGRTPLAKDVINEYRGSIMGYGPVYTYDEEEHMRDFVPGLLSYNQVEYSEKQIIVLGTRRIIKHIDGRIKSANHVRNGFHDFTDQKVIKYDGQESRCGNQRIISSENGVQVFGLNLRGTPEENLKGYLRGFDSIPYQKLNDEAIELLEIAHEQDGRQTQSNIEHDLRHELKYLRTRSSTELYYLILGVEEECSNLPDDVTLLSSLEGYVEAFGRELYTSLLGGLMMKTSKKEQALLNVLESFKNRKEDEEHEGRSLTSDIKDLVTVEESSNDSSYKKSKNLFNQQMGILQRNQNPLRMEGEFTRLSNKSWTIKGGPISFPRNESIPQRNIEFVQRNKKERLEIPLRTMFIRDFEYREKEDGIKIESKPLLSSSSYHDSNLIKFINGSFFYYLENESKEVKSEIDLRRLFVFLENEFEACKEACPNYWKEYWMEYASNNMKIVPSRKERVVGRVTNFPVELPTKMVKWAMTTMKYPQRTMFSRDVLVKKYLISKGEKTYSNRMFPITIRTRQLVPVVRALTGREILLRKRGRKSLSEKFRSNNGMVSTVRLFDDKNNPGPVMRKVSWGQYRASEQLPYQHGVSSTHTPSSFKVLHTVGDGKNNVDYYIIDINGQILYAKGDLNLLNKNSMSFTGTRNPSKETREFVKRAVNWYLSDKSNKYTERVTIAGGAEGCDSLVHYQTIAAESKTIVVLAGGFNQFRKKNQIKLETVLKHGGLILSEHPPEYSPAKKDFVLRNKIIVSLSEKLVAFEGGRGTEHTKRFAQEQGKEILVQPPLSSKKKIQFLY